MPFFFVRGYPLSLLGNDYLNFFLFRLCKEVFSQILLARATPLKFKCYQKLDSFFTIARIS